MASACSAAQPAANLVVLRHRQTRPLGSHGGARAGARSGARTSADAAPGRQVKDGDSWERQTLLGRVRSGCGLGRPWPQRRWRAALGGLLAASALVLLLLWAGRGAAPGLGRGAPLAGLLRGMGGGYGDTAAREAGERWLAERGLALRPPGAPLGVRILTADFWGLKAAGGTATAYHLLAQARNL